MDTNQVRWIAAASFFAGAVFQASYDLKTERRLKKQNELLKIENNICVWYMNEGRHMVDQTEANKLLNERITFLKIAQKY